MSLPVTPLRAMRTSLRPALVGCARQSPAHQLSGSAASIYTWSSHAAATRACPGSQQRRQSLYQQRHLGPASFLSSAQPGLRPSILSQLRHNSQDAASSKTSQSPHSSKTDPLGPSSTERSATKPPSAITRLIVRLRDAVLQSAAKAASRSGTGSGSENTIKPPTYPDLRRLISLAAPERNTVLLALALLLVSSAVSLAVPFTIGKVIDFFTVPAEGTPEAAAGDSGKQEKKIFGLGFNSMVAILLFVFATGAAAKAGSNIMLNLAGVRIVRSLREKCFGNAVKQEVEWVSSRSHVTQRPMYARRTPLLATTDSTAMPPPRALHLLGGQVSRRRHLAVVCGHFDRGRCCHI